MEMAHMTKYHEKHAQHQQLIAHLGEACHADVELHLLIFGSTGGILHLTPSHCLVALNDAAQHLKQLGVNVVNVVDTAT